MHKSAPPSLLVSILALISLSAAAQTLTAPTASAAPSPDGRHLFFRVQLPRAHAASSGRLLVFIEPAEEAEKEAGPDGKVTEVQISEFTPNGGSVAARDVYYLAPGGSVDIDTDNVSYPGGFSSLSAGDYDVQAVLDVNHDYNYDDRTPGDLVSEVEKVHLAAGMNSTMNPTMNPTMNHGPTLTLAETVPPRGDPWRVRPGSPAQSQAMVAQAQGRLTSAKANTDRIDFASRALTAFWGRDIRMRAWVLLPPGYKEHPRQKYPTVYFTHGFGGSFYRLLTYVGVVNEAMEKKQMPPMIWVFLDESSPTGTHEFADGVNNGPWGLALTAELIPYLESRYRMDARADGRFLNGHSSGGWATLWLETRYPKIFGGTWSTSPDPSDFHDFTGIDLYAPHANVYRRPDGTLYPIMREDGKVVASFESFPKLEQVLGPYGGQIASFEWVFSPRGPDGRPEQMFNRATGDVDPKVVQYWGDHYDIAYLIRQNWPALKPDLNGKIHVIVGTADTFYLDGAAHRLKNVLDDLHAKSDIEFLPGRTHFNLYVEGNDRWALLKKISWQMYAVARPGSRAPASATQ